MWKLHKDLNRGSNVNKFLFMAGVRFRETRDVGFLRAVAGWEPGLGGKAGAERSGRGRADSGGMAGAEAGKAPALESRAEAGAAPGPQPGGTVGADSENGTTAETGAKVGTRVEGSSAAVSVERDVPVRREAERAELEVGAGFKPITSK